MPFALMLDQPWKGEGWKVKIRDRERNEEPHVTILRGVRAWRLGLRTGDFLDQEPDPGDVPSGLVDGVKANWQELQDAWDRMYPENPITSEEGDDE